MSMQIKRTTSFGSFFRRYAAPVSIALAAAGCSPSTISRPDYQPKASVSDSRVVLSGSLSQVFRQMMERPGAFFQDGMITKEHFHNSAPDGNDNFLKGRLVKDVTIISNNRSVTFKHGTDIRVADGDFIQGTLGQDMSLTIAGNAFTIKAGVSVRWDINNGISGGWILPEDTAFILNNRQVDFKRGTELVFSNSSFFGTLVRDTELLIDNQSVLFKGGTYLRVAVSSADNDSRFFGRLARDTELLVGNQRVLLKGGANLTVTSSDCLGTLARDTDFLINNQRVSFKGGHYIGIWNNGAPKLGTLLKDTEIDGKWYSGNKEINIYPNGRSKKGVLAQPINEEGVALGRGETVCYDPAGKLINWRQLLPGQELLVPLLCTSHDQGQTQGIVIKELIIPMAEIFALIPDFAKSLPDQPVKVRLTLPTHHRPITTTISLRTIAQSLARQADLKISPNTIKITFDRAGLPIQVHVIGDLKINNQITMLRDDNTTLRVPLDLIPAIIRGAMFSKATESLLKANPAYKRLPE
ncbi:MAG: hypothetical protein WC500_01420 [Candidatus Margulisiibacteriota bacterium]